MPFENYIRGITSGPNAERIPHLREAVRLNPSYTEARLRLGRAYFDERQYDETISALSHVSATDPGAGESKFLSRASAAYYVGDFSRAESALNFVALRLLLPEVYSNMGAVAIHLGKRKKPPNISRRLQADSNDADYRFNLAVVLSQTGARSEAAEQLKQCLTLGPTGCRGRAFLDTLPDSKGSSPPSERVRTNYGETLSDSCISDRGRGGRAALPRPIPPRTPSST